MTVRVDAICFVTPGPEGRETEGEAHTTLVFSDGDSVRVRTKVNGFVTSIILCNGTYKLLQANAFLLATSLFEWGISNVVSSL